MPSDEGYDNIEELDDDGSRQKEVFARYGLAMYQAQVFEHGLVNVLVLAERMAGGIPTDEAFDARYERLFSETMARLKKRVVNMQRLDPVDVDTVERAVSRRNYLAHRFFREHATNFVTDHGSQLMLDDADQCRRLFDEADRCCEAIATALLARAGMSREDVERHAAELMAQARKGGG